MLVDGCLCGRDADDTESGCLLLQLSEPRGGVSKKERYELRWELSKEGTEGGGGDDDEAQQEPRSGTENVQKASCATCDDD